MFWWVVIDIETSGELLAQTGIWTLVVRLNLGDGLCSGEGM